MALLRWTMLLLLATVEGGGRRPVVTGPCAVNHTGHPSTAHTPVDLEGCAATLVPVKGCPVGPKGSFGTCNKAVYLHLPKTGTTMIRLLRDLLPACDVKGFVCRVPHGHGERSSPDEAASFNANVTRVQDSCHGHLYACEPASGVHFNYHSYLRPEWKQHGLSVVTVVRDPMERIISNVRWYAENLLLLQRNFQPHNPQRREVEHQITLDADGNVAAVSDKLRNFVTHYMTRALSGRPILKRGEGPGAVADALHNVRKMAWWGLGTDWTTLACVFYVENGLKTVEQARGIHVPNSRPGHNFANLTAGLTATLERYAKLDIMLYRTMEVAWQRRVQLAGCQPEPAPSNTSELVFE